MLRRLFKPDPLEPVAEGLYQAIVEQARRPAFYRDLNVPDSLDGRFELLALHAFLVLRRLKAAGPEAAGLARLLSEAFFADMDRSLREMGAGDLGVGRRVRTMAEAFYGRLGAYDAALEAGAAALAEALERNLYGTVEQPREADCLAMGAYVVEQARTLAGQEAAALLAGELGFGAPPDAVDGGSAT